MTTSQLVLRPGESDLDLGGGTGLEPVMTLTSSVGDDEWAFVAPLLLLLPDEASRRRYALRAVFTGPRSLVRTGAHQRGA
jgi:hypothetical protein